MYHSFIHFLITESRYKRMSAILYYWDTVPCELLWQLFWNSY